MYKYEKIKYYILYDNGIYPNQTSYDYNPDDFTASVVIFSQNGKI